MGNENKKKNLRSKESRESEAIRVLWDTAQEDINEMKEKTKVEEIADQVVNEEKTVVVVEDKDKQSKEESVGALIKMIDSLDRAKM